MQASPRLTRRAMLGALVAPAVVRAGSSKSVRREVRDMESRDGLTTLSWNDAIFHPWMGARHKGGGATTWPAVAPDCKAICWGVESGDYLNEPFLTISSEQRGVQEVRLDRHIPQGFVISSGANAVVVSAARLPIRGEVRLLVIDLTNGVKIHEAPSSLPVWGPSSISGAGDLVAFSEGSHVFLHELPSGKFLGQFDGGSPRISPDGRRIAYLRDERLLVRTLANRSDRILLPKSKMQGLTGWSPNGRYLLASGRTKLLALDRRYIAIDSESGEYAEIEKLWESDRGGGQTWVSAKLMNRN